MRTIRSLGLLLTLALVGAVAAPTAVAFEETSSNGTVGFYTVNDFNDRPGVACRYEDNAGATKDELDRIVIKPLWSHGPFATKSWVGFRFIVKANKPPLADGVFRTVYRSPIVKRKANQTEIANFSGSWRAPEGTRSEYQVKLRFIYYKKGSTSQAVGSASGNLEVYRHKLSAGSTYDLGTEGSAGLCRRNYHGL